VSNYIENVVLGQWSAFNRETKIRETAERDGTATEIWLEREPGPGGMESAEASIRDLAGFKVHADRVTGDKVERARPLAAQAEAGSVRLVRGGWNQAYLEELCAFPLGSFADQVDASSGAFNKLAHGHRWSIEEILAYGRNEVISASGVSVPIGVPTARNADASAPEDEHARWLAEVERIQTERLRAAQRGGRPPMRPGWG
jgi:predicted phage terminase large subunit-like protein